MAYLIINAIYMILQAVVIVICAMAAVGTASVHGRTSDEREALAMAATMAAGMAIIIAIILRKFLYNITI